MKTNIFLMILMMTFSYASEMNNLQQSQKTAVKTQTSSDYTFETGHPYADNEDITKEICTIPDDSGNQAPFIVSIDGEMEKNYDFITVDGKQFTGRIHTSFEVDNPCVTVHFTSDSSITKRGVIVTVGNTIFKTGNSYANNEDITKVICPHPIQDAYIVVVKGSLEKNYDFITVGQGKLTGKILKSFYVKEGPCFNIHFTSDGSITKEGVEVKVLAGWEP